MFGIECFAVRLKTVMDNVPGKNINEKAEFLGTAGSSLYAYISGKKRPPLDFCICVNEVTGVDLTWLLCGKQASSPMLSLPLFNAILNQLTTRLESNSSPLPQTELIRKTAMIYNFLIEDGADPASPDPARIEKCITLALG